MKGIISILLVTLLLFSGCTNPQPPAEEEITSFEECVEAGYPIMESYPAQCAVLGGETFTEDLEDEQNGEQEPDVEQDEEQDDEVSELYCEQDSDCACGTHIDTEECFYGNKEFVNTDLQCPDYCIWMGPTGTGSMELVCEDNVCVEVISTSEP